MNAQEKLFAAIGGAAPELVVRSEQRRRSRWPGYCLAAASLALILYLGHVLPSWTGPAVSPPDSQQAGVTTPVPPEVQKPDSDGSRSLILPPQGSEIGTLRLLSYAPQSQEQMVDFLIYVNGDQFSICEDNGLYSIRNINPLPDGFPECGLDIFHLSGTSPAEAREAAMEALKNRFTGDFSEEESAILPDSLYLRTGNGTDWDSEQVELWFVSDGLEGTFTLAARYFLEAEEGMGQCFRDMVSSFRVISLNEIVPAWMAELYETTNQLFPALFANDLSSISALLAEGAEADAYGENVWADITVASVDYTLDSDQNPSRATVSVKHRLNQVEGDSFRYLTMYLLRQEGRWVLNWAGVEK